MEEKKNLNGQKSAELTDQDLEQATGGTSLSVQKEEETSGGQTKDDETPPPAARARFVF